MQWQWMWEKSTERRITQCSAFYSITTFQVRDCLTESFWPNNRLLQFNYHCYEVPLGKRVITNIRADFILQSTILEHFLLRQFANWNVAAFKWANALFALVIILMYKFVLLWNSQATLIDTSLRVRKLHYKAKSSAVEKNDWKIFEVLCNDLELCFSWQPSSTFLILHL